LDNELIILLLLRIKVS